MHMIYIKNYFANDSYTIGKSYLFFLYLIVSLDYP
jgi:hypothetical protein